MSHWTYINGTINVTLPFDTVLKSRVTDYIDWSIAQTRKYGFNITGSESPAIFYSAPGNHPSLYSSEMTDAWGYGYISVFGSLRDREVEETVNETNAFLKKLSQFLRIENVNITINDVRIDTAPYEHLNIMDETDIWEKNEKYRDKLFEIRLMNSHRFFDHVLTLEKSCEIAEILTHVSPDTLEGLLCNFGIDRMIDWDFTDHRKEWFKSHKIPVRKPEESKYDVWFKNKKCPPKATPKQLLDKLENECYGPNEYNYSTEDRENMYRLCGLTRIALNNKSVMKKFKKDWG